jgi:hypothetical protein
MSDGNQILGVLQLICDIYPSDNIRSENFDSGYGFDVLLLRPISDFR